MSFRPPDLAPNLLDPVDICVGFVIDDDLEIFKLNKVCGQKKFCFACHFFSFAEKHRAELFLQILAVSLHVVVSPNTDLLDQSNPQVIFIYIKLNDIVHIDTCSHVRDRTDIRPGPGGRRGS